MENLKLKDVQSSNIEKIGYNEEDKILYVKYKLGKIYAYANVPKDLYESLNKAESKGSYMNSNIKNKFKYNLIVN